MKKVILLLTGTVKPGEMILTELTDPIKRQEQYIASLNYWLHNSILPIIFVENSETDLSKFVDPKFYSRIEFLTFKGNNYPKELGKGYGELNCLKYAYEKSAILQSADFAFKITGRYIISNFEKFYSYYIQNPDIYTYLDLKESLKTADSKIFGFNPSFLPEYLFERQHEINDSINMVFEHVLARATLESIVRGKKFAQFVTYPKVLGVSGTTNESYKSSFLFFLKKQLELSLKAFLLKR
jgi:hypothetical protein